MIAFMHVLHAEDRPHLRPLSDILPGNYHSSSYYRINDVSINNNNYVFTVESNYGNFRIESVGLTLKYLRETQIVSQVLNQIPSEVDSFQVDLQSQLRIEAESAIDILSSPLGTAGNLAGQLARNLGDTISGNSPYIIHESAYEAGERQDPNIAIHKRNISSQLGLDAYSLNGIVQYMLTRLARDRSAGKISSGSVLVNVNNNYEKSSKNGEIDREINYLLRTRTVEELWNYNKALLTELNIQDVVTRNFLLHKFYSPSLQTTIVKYLEYLFGIQDQQNFLEYAMLANDEVTATSFARVLKMITIIIESGRNVRSFKIVNEGISVITEENQQVYIFPDDIFYMGDDRESRIYNMAERARINGFSGVSLVAYGMITDTAKTELLANGIDYTERFLF